MTWQKIYFKGEGEKYNNYFLNPISIFSPEKLAKYLWQNSNLVSNGAMVYAQEEIIFIFKFLFSQKSYYVVW